MATFNLIQRFTSGSASEGIVQNRQVTEHFVPAGDFDAGDVVVFDHTQTGADRLLYVKQYDGSTNGQYFAGIAVEGSSVTGSDGRKACKVAIGGYVEGASVVTTLSQGEYLVLGGTAGELSGSATFPTATDVVGVSLEADTSGAADIFLWSKFI